MFESSLIESTAIQADRNRWPVVLSVAIQAVIVTILLLVPMLHPEVIPFSLPKMYLEAPRFTPPPPPPTPPQRIRIETATTSADPSAPATSAQPRPSFNTDAHPVDAPALPVGINLGETGPNPLTTLSTLSPASPKAASVSGPPATKATAGPVRVSTGVIAGLLVSPIRPDYPPIARISRTEGTVVIQAVISTTGRIESAHVVSGPAVLQASALQAVRVARYRPFLLNGAPTEVETTININFRMGTD